MARHGTRMRSTCEETSRRPGRNNKVVSSISRVEYAFRTRPPGRTKGEEEDEQGKKEKAKEKEADKGRERRKRERERRASAPLGRLSKRVPDDQGGRAGQVSCRLAAASHLGRAGRPADARVVAVSRSRALCVRPQREHESMCVRTTVCPCIHGVWCHGVFSEVGRWIGG